MNRRRMLPAALLLAACLAAVPAAAQTAYSELALSARPDTLVDHLTVAYGDPFTAYVVLVGPEGSPLPFGLQRLDWALLESCCGGSPAQMVVTEGWPGFQDSGDPTQGRVTEALDCATGDVVPIATLTFDWIFTPNRVFYLAAAALTAARTCDGGEEILLGHSLAVTPTGVTPAEPRAWGAVKAAYR